MTRHIKRGGKIWIRVFPDVPVTKKPVEVRMGKGKGNVEFWVSRIKPGTVLYEMEGVTEQVARDQAHATLGIYHAEKFEWDAADEEFRRAFELDPEYSTVHYWYAFTIISQNRIDDAIEHARIAAELDPLSLVNVRGYGFILMWAGRYEEALDQLDRVRELDPNFTPNWGAYARIYTVLGRWPEATEAFVRFAELRGWDPEAFRHATAAMERHAKEGRPVPIPADLEVAVPRSMLRAEIVAMLGQPDSAMAILERMYEDGDPNLREAGIHPMLASLHDDARFVALLERIGLTPVPAARTWMNDR